MYIVVYIINGIYFIHSIFFMQQLNNSHQNFIHVHVNRPVCTLGSEGSNRMIVSDNTYWPEMAVQSVNMLVVQAEQPCWSHWAIECLSHYKGIGWVSWLSSHSAFEDDSWLNEKKQLSLDIINVLATVFVSQDPQNRIQWTSCFVSLIFCLSI